ncbi:MAG: DUF350 domain-containing protein [Myxococcales bacterium]|nr:DUF350 domain-containing protein [Myxococcales bacterium]
MQHVGTALVFSGIGIIVFLLAFFIMIKVTPFSIRKEIEQDHNTSLAILIGAVILGLAHIVAAAISG